MPRRSREYFAPYQLVKTMRASILVLGPLLARFGHADVSLPGGCASARVRSTSMWPACRPWAPIFTIENGYIKARAGRLRGARLVLDTVTVTGTENLMMAAALADGETVLENAAREPEVVDLANFLIAMGAKIKGAGTDRIVIEGVQTAQRHGLRGAARSHRDRHLSRAGRHHPAAMFGSRTPGRSTSIRSSAKLQDAGARVDVGDSWIEVDMRGKRPQSIDIRTAPYPAFPTDMQAQFAALNTVANGVGTIIETIFENRFMHMLEMRRMGAEIRLEGNTAIIKGVERLTAAPVMATDLRASASLVLAALGGRRPHRDRAHLSHRSRL